jgi:Zn-dependent protease
MLMGGIAFHEWFHLLAGQRLGFKSHGFFLFPFIGGLSLTSGDTKRYSQKAFIAIAGPVGGFILAVATYLLYLLWFHLGYSGAEFIGQSALWMAFLNLFNLAPLAMLDGGQIAESIAYSINRTTGFVVMLVSTVVAIPLLFHFNPLIALMVAFFGYQSQMKAYADWKMHRRGINVPLPKSMSPWYIALTIAGYLGLAGCLALLMNQMFSLSMSGLFH